MREYTCADERRILKQYLTRYYRGKQWQEIMGIKLADIGAGNNIQEKCEVSILEKRLREQAEAAEEIAQEIMNVIDLLPDASTERTIMELRHIVCMPWREIHEAVHLTRSPCYKYYRRGLDALLNFQKVRRILELPSR